MKDNKKKLTLSGVTGRFVMSTVAALTGLSFLSVVINPAKAWFFALFGLFFPLLFLTDLFFFLWALRRRSRAALIPLVALLPSLFFVGSYFLPPSKERPAEPSEGAETVKIVTYNVGRFMQPKRRIAAAGPGACMDSVFSFLRGCEADVICLQEFYVKDLESVKPLLRKQLKGYRPEFYFHRTSRGFSGNVTLSRLKAADKGVIRFDNSTNLALFTDYDLPSGPVRVYNCHFESYNISLTGFLRSLAQRRSGAWKETEVKMKRGMTARPRQVNQVFDHISACGKETFVCGDFNDSPMSYTYFKLSRWHTDTFRGAGEWFSSTYSHFWPLLRIDYILCPKRYVPLSHRTEKKPFSDHFPVVALMEAGV